MPDNYEKVKDLSAHIVEECEKRGLTIGELNYLCAQLKIDLGNAVGKINDKTPFKIVH